MDGEDDHVDGEDDHVDGEDDHVDGEGVLSKYFTSPLPVLR